MQYGIINDSNNAVHYSPLTYLFYNLKFVLYILIPFSHFRLMVARGRRWGCLQVFCFFFFSSSEGPSWNVNMLWKFVSKFYTYQVGTDWLWAFLPGPQTFTRLVPLVAREYSPGRSTKIFSSLSLTPNPSHAWTHLSSSIYWDFSCGSVSLDPWVPMKIMDANIMVTWKVNFYCEGCTFLFISWACPSLSRILFPFYLGYFKTLPPMLRKMSQY